MKRPAVHALAGAGAVTLALVLAGCSGGSVPTGGASSEPQHGEALTVGVQQAPANLDPGTLDKAFTDFTMLAYDPLFYMSPEGEVQPRLAESWEWSSRTATP
jgi:peptide/nickel transport system substrate-binding protein